MKAPRNKNHGLNTHKLIIFIVCIFIIKFGQSVPQTANITLTHVRDWMKLVKTAEQINFWPMVFRQREDANQDKNDDNGDDVHSKWTTVDWLVASNYSYELHNVTTVDGYHLQMQRLPQPGAQPVLLVHGLLSSSLAWVLQGPSRSLAFQLHDTKKYDVWLGNLRGSTPYGRGHNVLNASQLDFWNYSFHEHGNYDMPALIDHIRAQTEFHQVLLIGHSQAFNAFLVLCAMQPVYNERILLIQALAPIVRLRGYVRFKTADVRRIMKFIKNKEKSQQYELFPAGALKDLCLKSSKSKRKLCKKYLRLITGDAQYSKSVEQIIYGQLLQGGSVKEVTHLQQIWKSGDFIAYDYDPEKNREIYNTSDALTYNLSLVTAPIVLHFGETDALATPAGVHSIYAKLLGSVRGVYRVPANKFNHLDFICAHNIRTLVNDKIIDIMEKYIKGELKYVIE